MKEKVIKIQRYRDFVKEFCGCAHDMMVERFYQKAGRTIFEKREKIRNSIKTIAQWKKEKQRIKRNLINAIGAEFSGKNLKIIERGKIKRDGFYIKKILFSIHKDHWVPSLIYVPEGRGPFPGILLPAGHSIEGKIACNEIAVFYVLNGYVAITYDFVGQGERALKDENGFVYAFASTAHNMVGVPMTLYGHNLNWFTIFESSAAIDVLKSTGIVDMLKIGITGASGGGTNSFYTAAFDERISATAPAASVHSFKNYIYPDDSEQSFFNHIESGLDYPDIASFLIAPRPLLIVANKHDIWDIEGTRYVYHTAKKFYRMFDAEKNIKITVSDKGHAYDIDQKTEVLLWFNEIFGKKMKFFPLKNVVEHLPSNSEISVIPDRKSRKYYLNNPLCVFRKNVNLRKQDISFIENIKVQLNGFAGKKIYFKIIDRYPIGNMNYCRMIFSPENGILLPAEIIVPEKPDSAAVLLDEIPRTLNQQWLFEYAYKNFLIIRPDLRGLGETGMKDDWSDMENWCQNVFSGKNFKLFILCHLLGKYIVVERAKDILALISIISRGYGQEKIVIHARGITAIPAIIAGIVDKRIEKIVLEEFLYSFENVFEKDYPVWKPDIYLQCILRAGFDIKDLCSMVQAKLAIRKPLDGLMKPVLLKRMAYGKSSA
ncbi:MAG: acetylxylan esterase [bacterium]|nr:acetylxylan esterase [bacterium]